MQGKFQAKDVTNLIQILVEDAFALLPKNVLEQVREYSKDTKSISYIVRRIYKTDEIKDLAIPEVIYYEGFKNIENIENIVREESSKLTNSERLYRDQYNISLNLLVNLWLTNLKKSMNRIRKIPKEGIYLRDSTGELYFHEEG
jgi:hypothetical protein